MFICIQFKCNVHKDQKYMFRNMLFDLYDAGNYSSFFPSYYRDEQGNGIVGLDGLPEERIGGGVPINQFIPMTRYMHA